MGGLEEMDQQCEITNIQVGHRAAERFRALKRDKSRTRTHPSEFKNEQDGEKKLNYILNKA